MKNHKLLLSFLFIFTLVFSACSGGGGSDGSDTTSTTTGTLSLNLTDAPTDDANVTGVFITITSIEAHLDGNWTTLEDFNTSVNPINLLDFQDGVSLPLGNFTLPTGKYTQVRFMLDAAEEGSGPNSNPGCFIQFNGDTNETLYVPSGSNTGYKANRNFTILSDTAITMTADFDVRKSIVVAAGEYKLKPTIRLVVTNETGTIDGNVTNLDSNATLYAYGYEDDISTWIGSSDYLEDVNGTRFSNAVTSAALEVGDGGAYILSFLAEGKYDLVIAQYTDNNHTILDEAFEVNVVNGETTTVDFTLP